MAKKNTEIVEKKETKKAMWLGSQALMGQVTKGSKDEKERQVVLMTARVLGVSPFGVNILGNLPYINKLGLSQKANDYSNSKVKYLYEWPQLALNDTDKAICKCKVLVDNVEKTDWIMGECSPVTMKMGTLKGYQNHMAQTRAKNRAILEAFGVKIHEEMTTNINALYQKKEITEKQKEALQSTVERATSTSIEEVEPEKGKKEVQFNNDLFTAPPVESKKGPDGEAVFTCSKCDEVVPAVVAEYSKKMYGKILCREDQKTAKRK
jgi:hypothetical protein